MGVNLVIIDGDTKIDLTTDTVSAGTLKKGETAHNSAGEVVTGTRTDLDDSNFEGILALVMSYEALASYSTVPLSRLPETTTEIGQSCFLDCKTITISEIPAGVTTIGDAAFNGCTGITTITFKGTPTTVDTCFYRCTNLTDIYVPWSEGDVNGAPWGASSATVHYNSTV